jgi:hypothetical protein
MKKEKEIWKDIPNYENLYQASNLGNIKSLGNNVNRKDKLLKPGFNNLKQLVVALTKNKIRKTYSVHSLIAKTFLNLDINFTIRVKHIDGNSRNNCFTNLKVLNESSINTNGFKMESPKHYNNEKGSLYKFAEDHKLNAWEFDIVKRIVRSRKKGAFKEDLEKTKVVIDLYLNEFEQNSNNNKTI